MEFFRDRAFIVLAVAGLILAALADLAAGPGMSLSLLYVLPLVVLVVAGGWGLGLLGALAAAVLELVVELALTGPQPILSWYVLVRLAVYPVIVFAVARLAEQRATESRLLRELEVEHARVEELSRRDVTGLYNSRYFHRSLDQALENARKDRLPVSVITLDLDNLKQINDARGHREGDQVIQAVADGIREVTGERYVSARLGGDEFAILLPNTGTREALALAEELLANVHGRSIAGTSTTPSVSIGVSTALAGSLDGEDLLHNADLAMYTSKRMGGGRVMTA